LAIAHSRASCKSRRPPPDTHAAAHIQVQRLHFLANRPIEANIHIAGNEDRYLRSGDRNCCEHPKGLQIVRPQDGQYCRGLECPAHVMQRLGMRNGLDGKAYVIRSVDRTRARGWLLIKVKQPHGGLPSIEIQHRRPHDMTKTIA